VNNYYKPLDRPTWENYFLGLAFFISERSEDAETQHGCIIVDPVFHHILGTGYNSLAKNVEPYELPNVRKDGAKYPHMIHAEENACLNTRADLFMIAQGAIAYVTAKPCLGCLYKLYNKNIRTIYYAETGYHFQGYEAEAEHFDAFVNNRRLLVYSIKPDPSWMKRPLGRLGLLDTV
jgi:dCMP deaminase